MDIWQNVPFFTDDGNGHSNGTVKDNPYRQPRQNLSDGTGMFAANAQPSNPSWTDGQKSSAVPEKNRAQANPFAASGSQTAVEPESSRKNALPWLDAIRESDNAAQQDGADHIRTLAKTKYGQGVMDVYHSAAAGAYGTAQQLATTASGMSIALPPPDTAMFRYLEDYRNGVRKQPDLLKSIGNEFFVLLEKEKRRHENARSDDFNKSWTENHSYLPVKALGSGAEKIATYLGTLAVLSSLGASGNVAAAAMAGWDGFTSGYNKRLSRAIDIPEKEMRENGMYVKLRDTGWSDTDARVETASGEAAQEGWISMLVSAVAAMASYFLVEKTQTGAENAVTAGVQRAVAGLGSDFGGNRAQKELLTQKKSGEQTR